MIMVTIRIKQSGKPALLITFSIRGDRFDSPSEKSKFFEELYGRNQTIKGEKKIYKYHRDGMLDNINHIKVDNSVFIIAMQHMQEMMNFFDEWEDKVMVKHFPVLLDDKESKEIEIE